MKEVLNALYSYAVTFIIMVFIMVVRYLAGSLVFYLYAKRTSRPSLSDGVIKKEHIKHDIASSIYSSLVFAVFGTLLITLWEKGKTSVYLDFHQYPLWYLPLSFGIYLLIHDAYFYWTHRLFHLPQFLKFHVTHHRSRNPTAWTSFSFHPVEALIHAVYLPVMVMLIPVHWSILGLYLLVMSLFGITNHLGLEIYPRWTEHRLKLITATHHQKHHHHMNENFGLYFTFWDLLMGSEKTKERK